MRRRDFLRATGLAASTIALPARAKDKLPLVVWLSFADANTAGWYHKSVVDGLRARGLVAGQTIRLESYFANFSRVQAQKMIADIIAKKPAAVVVQGTAVKLMAKATRSIPLVVGSSGDMVEAGLLASLARPGGNVTGVQFLAIDLVGKRLEMLKEIVPDLKQVAVIADPGHPGETNERAKTIEAARQLGIRVDYKPVTNPSELQAALDSAAFSGVQAIVAFPDAITFGPRKRIADFAIEHKLPTVSGWDAYADGGFLLVYGPSLTAAWSRMAYFVDRIIKGAKPSDLPAEMPSVIEMIVNLKTAKALGVKVPPTVLLRANRVIE